jgi:putative endonuclease
MPRESKFAVRCLLSAVCCLLFAVYCLLFAVYCLLFAISCYNPLVDSSQPTPTDAPEQPPLSLGKRGEAFAAAYLEQAGYRLVAANFIVPVGRNLRGAVVNAEIDLVAYEGNTLCFVEVKTRASDWFAPPQINVDRRKQRQIMRAADTYRRMFGLEDQSYRYDVVTVILSTKESDSVPRIALLRNFWTEATTRKRRRPERYYE